MAIVRLVPRRFEDARGWFSETWHRDRFRAAGLDAEWVQDNHAFSHAALTLRGIHFQAPPHAQAKLVRCVAGRVWDVAVDLRVGSPTFGRWIAAELSAAGGEQLFLPAGFGHAYLTLEPDSALVYKVSAFHARGAEGGLAWDDPDLAIAWPLGGAQPILSDKDRDLPCFGDFASPFGYDGPPLALVDT